MYVHVHRYSDGTDLVVDEAVEAELEGEDLVAFGDHESYEGARRGVHAACRSTQVRHGKPKLRLKNQSQIRVKITTLLFLIFL